MRRLSIMAGVAIGLAMLAFSSVASALTIHDVIELSKAGVSDEVLLELIHVDHRVYTIDADAVKRMQTGGVSDTVMLAMIRAGRDVAPSGAAEVSASGSGAVAPPASAPQPQVIVVDHADAQPVTREVEVPVPVPVAVPVAVPVVPFHQQHISTIITTDTGAAVRARVPVPANCTKVEPVYWGNGGKRRPGTWAPPPQIVCR